MADISKCAKGCDKQHQCYRWTAPTSEWCQSYGDFKPDENGVCEHFWDNEERR